MMQPPAMTANQRDARGPGNLRGKDLRAPGRALVGAWALTFAVALAAPAPPPPALEPLPEIPPPPGVSGNADLEPQVTITQRQGDKVEEARVNGVLKWVRVTPRYGAPYYLIPDPTGHTFIRRDSNDTGLKVPLWVLFSF